MFVDRSSEFTYIHLIKYQNVYEAVEAKGYLKSYAEYHGVEIKHDHADNVIFRSAWHIKHCKDMHQGLTFVRANDHNKNGQAERRIR